jgi:hypothetical protein
MEVFYFVLNKNDKLPGTGFYKKSKADSEVARLREALEDLLGWQQLCPQDVVDRAKQAIAAAKEV